MKIQNRYYCLLLDDKTGEIVSFTDGCGKEYIGARTPLVEFDLLDEQGQRRRINSSSCAASIEQCEKSVRISFTGVGEESLDCVATVRFCAEDNLTYWSLDIVNHTGDIVECVNYPGITVRDDLVGTGGTRKLFSPMMEGVEIEHSALRAMIRPAGEHAYPPQGWGGEYPGACPLQFMADYDGESGLYFASHDAEGNYKFVDWRVSDGGIRLSQKMYPQMGNAQNYSYPYEVVIGSFAGDWYDAAEIYRQFVYASGMVTVPKLRENAELPEWIHSSPVVITYPVRGTMDTGDMTPNCYFPFSDATPVINRYSELFNSKIMALLMHWEGTAPWAPPYVMPPFGGTEGLVRFADELHEKGNLLGVYCSGIGWTQQSGNERSYVKTQEFDRRGLADCMEVGPDQQLKLTPICEWPLRNGYDMCPSCEQVKEIAVGEAAKIVSEVDVDYVQFFDQNVGGNTYACYSKKHNHPPAPGKWMIEQMREIVHGIKKEWRALKPEKKVLLGCESAAAEPLVNDLFFNDLRYNINFRFGVPVPAYSYIFHGYVCNFMGNQNGSGICIDWSRYRDNVFYRYAYSFLEGDILTVVLKNDGLINWDWDSEWDDNVQPNQEELIAFIRLLNDWRKGCLQEALCYGTMRKPLDISCGIYEEQLRFEGCFHHIPEIVSMRYTTEAGEDVQIFVNYQRCAKEFDFNCGEAELIRSADGEEYSKLSGGAHHISLPAYSVCAVRL